MKRSTLVIVLSIVALVLAGGVVAVVLATSGVDKTAEPSRKADPDAGLAAARDAAIEAGAEAAKTLNTLDYTNLEEGLDRWEAVTTGDLHEELVSRRAAGGTELADARTRTEATVRTAALAEFDAREGTARLLVALDVDIRPENGEARTSQLRLSLTLAETADGWKASGIERK